MKRSEHEDIPYLQNADIQWIPKNYHVSLKQLFQSIKHGYEFQFPAVAFVVQKGTKSKYSCASLYFLETPHLED